MPLDRLLMRQIARIFASPISGRRNEPAHVVEVARRPAVIHEDT